MLLSCCFFTDQPDVEEDSRNRQFVFQNEIASEISTYQRSREWVSAQNSLKPCNETVVEHNSVAQKELSSTDNQVPTSNIDVNNSNLFDNFEIPVIQDLSNMEHYAPNIDGNIKNNVLENTDFSAFCVDSTTLTDGFLHIEKEQVEAAVYSVKSLVEQTNISTEEFSLEEQILEKEHEEQDFFDDDSLIDPNFVAGNTDASSSEEEILQPVAKKRKNKNATMNNKGIGTEICLTVKKKGRSRKQREMAKLLRNTGKEYVDEKGNTVKARIMKPLTDCRMKCKNRFSDEIRHTLFKEYWKLGQHDKRTNFLSSLICIFEKKTTRIRTYSDRVRNYSCKYELSVNGVREPICK